MTLPMTLIVVTGEIDLSVASILGHVERAPRRPRRAWLVRAPGDRRGARRRRRRGLPERLPRHACRSPVARGDHRHPYPLSRHRRDHPRAGHDLGVPAKYTKIGVTPLPHTGGYLSYSVGIFIVLAILFAVVLHATPFGRSLFVMGANEEAARFAGMRVKRTKLLLFVVSGVVCALAGVLYTFRLSTAVQDDGLGLELNVVTIVLLGGISIFGGRGTIVGVVLAIARLRGLAERALPDGLRAACDGRRRRDAAPAERADPERRRLRPPRPRVRPAPAAPIARDIGVTACRARRLRPRRGERTRRRRAVRRRTHRARGGPSVPDALGAAARTGCTGTRSGSSTS